MPRPWILSRSEWPKFATFMAQGLADMRGKRCLRGEKIKVKKKRCTFLGWKKKMVVAMVGFQQIQMLTRMCVCFFAILFLFFFNHLDDWVRLWGRVQIVQQRVGCLWLWPRPNQLAHLFGGDRHSLSCQTMEKRCDDIICCVKGMWGFIKKPVLSITSSGEIGFWEHDIEASKMQGRARGRWRAQDIPYHHISPYHYGIWRIFIECGKKPHARARARKGEAQGVLSYQKVKEFSTTPM